MNYRQPFLIQRILKPSLKLKMPANADSFGIYKTDLQDLTDSVRTNIRGVLPLDYMGSAEYEFGAVPKALKAMANKTDMLVTTFEVTGQPYSLYGAPTLPETSKKVYLLAHKDVIEQVKSDICKLAKDDYAFRCKERSAIRQGVFGTERHGELETDHHNQPHAWLDLDNLWFMSTTSSHMNSFQLLMGNNVV